MHIDKRKHKRFRGKEGAYAAFLRSDGPYKLGNIIDIGIGGLSTRYIWTDEETGSELSGIKIFGANGSFIQLDKLECCIVYDMALPNNSWSQLITRRCGVRFKDLDDKQISLLRDFISRFTYPE